MGVEEAVKMSSVYGVTTVMFFLMAFFLGGLIIFVLKQGAKREERLANIIEINITQTKSAIEDHDKRSAEAISMIKETKKYERLEHEAILKAQEQQTKILNHIANKLGVMV